MAQKPHYTSYNTNVVNKSKQWSKNIILKNSINMSNLAKSPSLINKLIFSINDKKN